MHDIKVPDGDDMEDDDDESEKDTEPGEYVRVKFAKFVQLVATHNFEQAISDHGDEDVAVSTNLLTDLANAHEEAGHDDRKKMPLMLLVGVILGIVITYIILQF